MPWYTPWSDHIAKRVCKYLLQRYLGQFLEEKLTLDQLNVDLYKGTGTITDVALDVLALNEVAEQQNIPFHFIDGFIEEMSVAIPWSSLLSESSDINVRGLTLTFKYKERDKSKASMFESMWGSMSSSMQLAEDCLRNEKETSTDDTTQSFEGIERFAQTIDSILCRIRVKFSDTVLRLEEELLNGTSGVALVATIEHMEYWDEAGERPVDEDSRPELIVPIFSTKRFLMEGVSFFSDEFSIDSPTNNVTTNTFPFTNEEFRGTEYDVACTASDSFHSEESSTRSDNSVLMARLAGRQEVAIQFKHEDISGPKVELTVRLGALAVFGSPRQVHQLIKLVQAMSGEKSNQPSRKKSKFSQKPMEESDFRKIEQELLTEINQTYQPQSQGLGSRGWASSSMEGSSDFLPLNNISRYNESVVSSTSSLASSTSSLGSSKSGVSQPSYIDPKRSQAGVVDADPSAAVFRFHVSLCSVAIVLIHDDILAMPMPAGNTSFTGGNEEGTDGPATPASVQAMRRVAEDFFAKLGHFAVYGFGNKDFHDAKQVFSNACQHNHIRFLAAPVIFEGSELSAGRGSVLKGSLSAASVQLLECLIDKDPATQANVWEYIELLTFTRSKEEEGTPHFEEVASLKLDFKLYEATSRREKGRKVSQPLTEVYIELQPVEVELDVTLIDRISSLLSMEPCCDHPPINTFRGKAAMSNLKEALDNTVANGARHKIRIFSSFVILKIRFPIPDMRPIHDMDRAPWWRRNVRPDALLLDVTDLSLQTIIDPMDPVSQFVIEYRKLVAKFQDGNQDLPVPFFTITADPASNTILDGGQGFGWPRMVLSFHPKNNNLDLELSEPNFLAQSMGHMSLIAALERTQRREISPFSFQRVIHDGHGDGEGQGEELVTPASKEELAEFRDVASLHSRMNIDIFCPTVSLFLPSKRLYELIYNRLTMDLLMWKPSAPVREMTTTNLSGFSFDDNESLHETFNLCKSGIQLDSDSDESQDGMFFSVSEQKERHRKKKAEEINMPRVQSRISVGLTVGQGLCDLYLPVRDSQGNIIPEQSGELLLVADEVNFFYVSGFNGKKDLDYMCVQGNHVTLYHTGLLTESCYAFNLRSVGSPIPHYLQPTIMRMDNNACPEACEAVGTGSTQSLDMLTAAVKVSRDEHNRSLKYFRVALGLRNSSLRYRVCEARNSWFNQIVDFFDVDDLPIVGYEPSTVVTELNLHLWNCNIDYRPLHLPLRSVLNLRSFNISSNITAKTNSSTLRFIAEDASFYISDKMGHRPQICPVNLQKDYVCVMQLALFELLLRLCDLSLSNPKVDLRASANTLLMQTCSDSAKALMELLSYFAAEVDLHGWEMESETPASSATVHVEEEEVLVSTEEEPAHLLSKSQVARVHDLMQEAMQESRVEKKPGAKAYFVTDGVPETEGCEDDDGGIGIGSDMVPQLGSDLINYDELDDGWENEFCILENEAGMGILPKSGLPEVRQLTTDPPRLVDNHFALPTGRTDHLRSPKHYPRPVMRYTLRELSLLWQMYGGSDFDPPLPPKHVNIQQPFPDGREEKVSGSATISFSKNHPSSVRFEVPSTPSPLSKLTWRERGGAARRHDILMELQLNKVQFQHEVYPEYTDEVSRQVLLVKDLELRDRLASSQINKFLYQYYSEAKPKQAHANMVVIKALQIRSDPKVNAQECCLKVSLLPLRFNIDQDSLIFLIQFFSEIAGVKEEEATEEEPPVVSRNPTPTHAPPVMSVTTKGKGAAESESPPAPLLIQLEEPRPVPKIKNRPRRVAAPAKAPSPPLFFRCVIFSPEVPVRLDYQGKHVDLTHGPLAGILMGLGQLNNSELKLKRIAHRHGLLGLEKLVQFILNEWSVDLKRNQLPGLLGGVGPIHSVVQLFQGVRDLFWLPIEQYKKDGRLVRGFQRGANSFTTSSAMAVLELTSRLIQIIQCTAETAYDMVSPGPSVRAQRRGKDKRRQYSQPADIREGLANAIMVVKHGIGETAVNLVRVANEEHEQKGVTGAVGGVLRQIPPTVVKPIILATEATNNVIGGMRSQLVPDARKEAVDKWRGNST